MIRVLFVCHGNICRSPMAEYLFKAMAAEKGIPVHAESAAVSTEEIGHPIYPPAARCLRAHGIPFDPDRRARQVSPADYGRFDRIVCMDKSNLRLLRHILPDDPEHKVHLALPSGRDVADPWYTGDFERTYRDLLVACEALL